MTSPESQKTRSTRQSQDPKFGMNLDTSIATTELLSSQTIQAVKVLGKRVRAEESSIISVEPKLQKLKVTHGYHDPKNKNFVPKYISDRIPIPMTILGKICNEYLDNIDRDIIKGDLIFVQNPMNVKFHRIPILPIP